MDSIFRCLFSAVSASVVLPCILNLYDNGYGVDQGIPSVVMAACTLDDVIAVAGFSVILGVMFNNSK